MKKTLILPLLVGALCVPFVAGCGGSDEPETPEAKAEAAVQDFLGAYTARDFERVCDMLASSGENAMLKIAFSEILNSEVEADDCPAVAKTGYGTVGTTLDNIEHEGGMQFDDTDVAPDGQSARVVVDSGEAWNLEEVGGSWQIANLDPIVGG